MTKLKDAFLEGFMKSAQSSADKRLSAIGESTEEHARSDPFSATLGAGLDAAGEFGSIVGEGLGMAADDASEGFGNMMDTGGDLGKALNDQFGEGGAIREFGNQFNLEGNESGLSPDDVSMGEFAQGAMDAGQDAASSWGSTAMNNLDYGADQMGF